MKLRTVELPKLQKCRECKVETRFELEDKRLVEIDMHDCRCSKSEDFKKRAACAASGGHDFYEVSAGSHSFFVCDKCGAHG